MKALAVVPMNCDSFTDSIHSALGCNFFEGEAMKQTSLRDGGIQRPRAFPTR